jgi:hypothetical protein
MGHKLDTLELESLEVDKVGEVKSGMMLEHPVFGIGKVEAIYQFIKSGDITIRIDFEEHGSKALVPEYANLSNPEPQNKQKNNARKIGILSRFFGGKE